MGPHHPPPPKSHDDILTDAQHAGMAAGCPERVWWREISPIEFGAGSSREDGGGEIKKDGLACFVSTYICTEFLSTVTTSIAR